MNHNYDKRDDMLECFCNKTSIIHYYCPNTDNLYYYLNENDRLIIMIIIIDISNGKYG